MIKIAIVVFRECLEIALLLSIILAVTKPVNNSRVLVILGALIGMVLASIFAIFTRQISTSFGGLGDEIYDSIIILITALMVSLTVVWMQGYAKKIKKDLTKLSDKIKAGTSSQLMLVLVVSGTVLREGAEIILLIYSLSASQTLSGSEYIVGISSGAGGGFLFGYAIYRGMLKYASKYVFKISTILLILISAGLASEAAGILTSSGLINTYTTQVWDSSWLIENSSVIGKILNATFGYDSKPNALQVIFYFATAFITVLLIKIRAIFSRHDNA